MKNQYITNEDGKKVAVILSMEDYNKMLEDLEMLEDIKLYDLSKKSKQVFVDADKAFEEIENYKKD
jgi:PHD/YefM family antitoxin component YafN of YafNO toxin-antitoxin module